MPLAKWTCGSYGVHTYSSCIVLQGGREAGVDAAHHFGCRVVPLNRGPLDSEWQGWQHNTTPVSGASQPYARVAMYTYGDRMT